MPLLNRVLEWAFVNTIGSHHATVSSIHDMLLAVLAAKPKAATFPAESYVPSVGLVVSLLTAAELFVVDKETKHFHQIKTCVCPAL